jgi:hypothetical protein
VSARPSLLTRRSTLAARGLPDHPAAEAAAPAPFGEAFGDETFKTCVAPTDEEGGEKDLALASLRA